MKISNLKFKIYHNKQSGQVLLITVMLLATVLTVVLSTSFKSTTDIKITKLEEESQKALAASEAALEDALKTNSPVNYLGSGNLISISGFSGGAAISHAISNTFTTPLLQTDEQYTFYVGEYNETTKAVGNSTAEDITICFNTSSINPALEITLLQQNNSVKKYVVDPNLSKRIAHAYDTESCSATYSYSYTVHAADISNNTKLMLVHMLYNGGKILFSRSSPFYAQGRTVSSEARSNTGVTKSVELFQSYPQIPAEFFVTSF